MKKILGIAIALILLTGCGTKVKKQVTLDEKQEIMKKYATEYFNLHMSGSEFLADPTITLEDLTDATEVLGDNFDLSNLKTCTDTSSVTLKLNKQTNEILDYNFNMDCK